MKSLTARVFKIIVEKKYLSLEELRRGVKGQALMRALNELEERGFIKVGERGVRVTYSGLLASEKWKPKGRRVTLVICDKELKGFQKLLDNVWVAHGTVKNVSGVTKMYGLSLKEVPISRSRARKVNLIEELYRVESLARKVRTERGLSYATVRLLKLVEEASESAPDVRELNELRRRIRKLVLRPNKSRLMTEIANFKRYIKNLGKI